jgi:small subunit ribosomal protein S9
MSDKHIFAVGRRKTSVARAALKSGSGKLTINGREVKEYFPISRLETMAISGLRITGSEEKYDIKINVYGGGPSGQAGAVRLAISRAIQMDNPELRAGLKKAGFLRRDSRMVERKKYGLHKARRGTQFSKR